MADIYYKLDKKTREELISTVKRVAIEILEGPKETWITADEVTKMWPFFSKEWMKRYGYLLPRKRIVTIIRMERQKAIGFILATRYFSPNECQFVSFLSLTTNLGL